MRTPTTMPPLSAPAHPAAGLRRALVPLVALAVCLGACGPASEDAAAPAGERITAEGLALALQPVPAGFAVAESESGSERLVLESTDPERPGTIAVYLGDYGHQNIPDAVWNHKREIEAAPQGRYQGQNELGGAPLGTTYVSRGERESASGELVEQYRALTLHPTRTEILVLDYEYPAGQAENRLDDLIGVLAALEPLSGEGSPAQPAEGEAAEETSSPAS